MAEEWNDSGIVLAKGTFRESDVWLRMLFREHGVQTAFAFGGMKSRRRFVGCLDVLNVLDCHVRTSGRDGYLDLCEAVLTEGPGELRSHPAALGMAINCLRFAEACGMPDMASGDIYILVREALHVLAADENPSPLFILFFRLRLAALLGFTPELDTCGSCGERVTCGAVLSVADGMLLCPSCAAAVAGGRRVQQPADRHSPQDDLLRLSPAGLSILRWVLQSGPADWPGSELSPAEARSIGRAVDAFIQFHLGLAWEHGRFLRV